MVRDIASVSSTIRHRLGNESGITGDFDKGINYLKEAKLLAEKLNYKKGIANAISPWKWDKMYASYVFQVLSVTSEVHILNF